MESIRVTRAGEGEHFLIATDVITIKASGLNTSDRIVLIEVQVRPGEGPPAMHRHAYSEAFYVLSGEFEFVTTESESGDRTTVRITEGDTIALPSMAWHNFKNIGSTTGKLLSIHSPSGMENFARELGIPIDDPLNPPQTIGPPSEEQRQKMMTTIRKYMEIMPFDSAGH